MSFHHDTDHHFRIVDLYGEQVTDFAGWVKDTKLVEKLSMAHTRLRLLGVPPVVGEYPFSNRDDCAGNIAEVMQPFGMRNHLEVIDPFNIFMNTPNYTLKRLNPSRPGDFMEFKAMKDVIVAVISCPYDMHGVEGRKPTDIAVITGIQLMDATAS
ncbi:hypothetical protein B0A55_09570 [Friedmanniomyces simplex]|uniref:Uncharacterized protein n=1 Tax=Friedmanniomyces simplex TaxID=329884 RepID=A0A4U0X0T3_9PEZI|nr:hypothetical protein B0A55_09570 [Friedmanniomyces simplex]